MRPISEAIALVIIVVITALLKKNNKVLKLKLSSPRLSWLIMSKAIKYTLKIFTKYVEIKKYTHKMTLAIDPTVM